MTTCRFCRAEMDPQKNKTRVCQQCRRGSHQYDYRKELCSIASNAAVQTIPVTDDLAEKVAQLVAARLLAAKFPNSNPEVSNPEVSGAN